MNNIYTDNKTTFVRDTMTNPGTGMPGADKISTGDYEQQKTACDTHQYCWHRLPCGICKLTNSMCPFGGTYKYTITC